MARLGGAWLSLASSFRAVGVPSSPACHLLSFGLLETTSRKLLDMATYWRVSPKFWSDPKVLAWDEDTRFLALYILTSPHRNAEGLFRLPQRYICADLEWSQQRLAEPFKRLVADRFIDYDENTQVCLIRKALEYQSPQNPNQVNAALRHLTDLPPSPRLTSEFKRLAERFSERLFEALPERFGESLTPSLPPSPKTPSAPKHPEDTAERDSQFDAFWAAYPRRDGKKLGKDKSRQLFNRLTASERERALIGVRNYAASGQRAKDPERFLRKDTAGAFPFDDWQEAGSPATVLPFATGGTGRVVG